MSPSEPVESASADLSGDLAEMVEPLVQEIRGHASASQLGRLAHVDAQTERMVAPVQREGFILDIAEVPQMVRLDLEWTGTRAGEMFLMVNVPTAQEGKVIDYMGEWSAEGKTCMMLPVEELVAERISIMAHSRDAANVDFVLRVTTVGGEATLVDAPHMEVERGEAEEHDALPCEDEDHEH